MADTPETSVAGSVQEVPREGRRNSQALLFVLLLAAVLRLSHVDLVPLTNGMATSGLTANVLVAGDPDSGWPLAGSLGEGVRGTALFVYLVWLPNLLVWHPLTGVVLVVLLNIVSVGQVHRLAGRWFGQSTAIAASLLYACSPWAVVISRQLWAGSCLAVISLYIAGVALKWLESGGPGRLVQLLFLGLVIPQVHFAGLAVTAWVVVVLMMGRDRIRTAPLVAGISFGVATWTPWLAFHHMGRWTELRDSMSSLTGKLHPGEAIIDGVDFLQAMLHSGRFDHWFASSPADLPAYFPAWLRGLLAVVAVVMVLALAAAVTRAVSRSAEAAGRRVDILLLLLFFLPLPLSMVYRPAIRPEHLVVILPFAPIIVGSVFGRWMDLESCRVKWAIRATLGVTVAAHVLCLSAWSSFLADDLAVPQGEYGLSFRQRRDVARWILRDCDGRSVELAGPFRGGHPAYEYIYYFERSRRGFDRSQPDPHLRYWIDEAPEDQRLGAAARLSVKERDIGSTLNRFQNTGSRWRIEHHHAIGTTRIYRIRMLENTPFQTAGVASPIRSSGNHAEELVHDRT